MRFVFAILASVVIGEARSPQTQVPAALFLMLISAINFPTVVLSESKPFRLAIGYLEGDPADKSRYTLDEKKPTTYVETADNQKSALYGRLLLQGSADSGAVHSYAYFKLNTRGKLVHKPTNNRIGFGLNNRLVRGGTELKWEWQSEWAGEGRPGRPLIVLGENFKNNILIICTESGQEIRVLPNSAIQSWLSSHPTCRPITFVVVSGEDAK